MILKNAIPPWVCGEVVGTFLLVFFGCGSVASAVLTGAQVGIFQVAIIWGLGIATAIHLTASLSGAHLNPAVTLSFAIWRGFPRRRVVPYIFCQVLGSILASAVLYVIFADALTVFEQKNGITRGLPGSEASAMIFGEYFPNPGGRPLVMAPGLATHVGAFFTEVIGTAILLLVIFAMTDEQNENRPHILTPAMIGLTVTMLISLFGPITMACFNPARDFGPRLFSTWAGWGVVPFTANGWGWLTVYVLAPFLGGLLGGGAYVWLLKPGYKEVAT
jgi:glycerol uptake facilitator protein